MRECSLHSDSVGEIIHRACNEEQSLPDLSVGNQFANTLNPRSPCRSSPVLARQEPAPVSSSDLRPTQRQRAFLQVERERRCPGSGSASGGTGNSCSACTCNTSRLVTRILSCGQAASTSTICTPAVTTCSKLSRRRNMCLCCNSCFTCSSKGWPVTSRMSSV